MSVLLSIHHHSSAQQGVGKWLKDHFTPALPSLLFLKGKDGELQGDKFSEKKSLVRTVLPPGSFL